MSAHYFQILSISATKNKIGKNTKLYFRNYSNERYRCEAFTFLGHIK